MRGNGVTAAHDIGLDPLEPSEHGLSPNAFYLPVVLSKRAKRSRQSWKKDHCIFQIYGAKDWLREGGTILCEKGGVIGYACQLVAGGEGVSLAVPKVLRQQTLIIRLIDK